MDLIFLKQGDLRERSWVEFLLGEVITSSSVEEPWPKPRPNTIYALSSNTLALQSIPREFLAEAERTQGVGLVHLSDEWLGGKYEVYRSFDFVLRNYWKKTLRTKGILTIPLGFPGNAAMTGETLPASQRTYTWMFFGNMIASRVEMMRAFAAIPRGGKKVGTRIDHDAFGRMMSETVFVPAPMGNLVAETWRFYEALEAGCIPIVESRMTIDYYKKLLGPHPIPTFSRWAHAASFVRALAAKEKDLDELQTEIMQWWSAKKRSLVSEVAAFVAEGRSGAFRSDLKRLAFAPYPIAVVNQYLELARYQTLESTFLLMQKVIRRGSAKLPY